jgi:dTMP kinase
MKYTSGQCNQEREMSMKGKLIIIESGSDASGKATQARKLYERLTAEGYKVKKVEYPNYNSDSSALIKMYLNGAFGTDPGDVNPYVASTFYAVDRYASYKTEWEDFYRDGGIIIADRYTTSNMVHQAAKIEDGQEKEKFLTWLWNFEFEMYKLPVPDCVVFLDMPPEKSRRLMEERKNKFTGELEKDIHERNVEYLISSYNNAVIIADRYNWNRVKCVKDDCIKNIDEIHEDIYNIVVSMIENQ